MYVSIRTDSSTAIGTGHAMRCLTLAETLQQMGATVSFLCRDDPGNINSLIEKRGFMIHRLPSIHRKSGGWEWNAADAAETFSILQKKPSVDWLIVDHYALDWRWEQGMRRVARKIMVIDDLANRRHDCDLLLDQNLHARMETRYRPLMMRHCRILIGPKYALLRPQFYFQRQKLKKHDGTVRRIHICFGGSDPANQTLKALEAVTTLSDDWWQVDVVAGRANPHKNEVIQACSRISRASFFCHVEEMATLLAKADLAIGGGGSSIWERCCLGVPSLIVSIADNQTEVSRECHRRRIVKYLGKSDRISTKRIQAELMHLATDREALLSLRARAMETVDGLGAMRVCLILLEEPPESITDTEVEQRFFQTHGMDSSTNNGKKGYDG